MARMVLLVAVLAWGVTWAASQVRVLALFPGKALLEIDGQRRVLAQGRQFAGVELIEASPREARVRIGGRVETLQLGNAVASRYARPEKEELRLLGNGNSFFADALINGQPARMLVDTGATTVALSETQARKLGIPYVREGKGATVQTASGVSRAYAVKLDSLKLGTRTFHDVQAMVIEGDGPANPLLGMNVLRRFDIDHRRNLMILRAK